MASVRWLLSYSSFRNGCRTIECAKVSSKRRRPKRLAGKQTSVNDSRSEKPIRDVAKKECDKDTMDYQMLCVMSNSCVMTSWPLAISSMDCSS